MKKTLLVLIAVMTALSMFCSACLAEGAEGMTFAGITPQEDQFGAMLSSGMAGACAAYGAEFVSAMSNGDQEKERSLLETYGTQEVNGICIMPASNISTPQTMLNCWNDYHIPLSVADGEIEQDGIFCGSTTSHVELGYGAGKLAVEYIQANPDRFADGIRLGVVTFKTQYAEPATDRMNNFLRALDEAEIEYDLVAEVEAAVQDVSLQVSGDMITAHPDMNLIYACNDGGTIGAVQAVKNAGMGDQIKVFGIDCGAQQIDMLRADDDILQGVAAQDAYGMGYTAMERLIQYVINDGEVDYEVGTIDVRPATPVTRMDPASIDAFEQLLAETM